MEHTYSRGEIYYAHLTGTIGSEQSGYRPVVIIQNDIGNRFSPTVIVAPISSNVRPKAFEIAQLLRKNNIKADVDLNGKKFKKLMNYADKIKVEKIAIIGEKDLEQGKITIKDMISGNQELVDIDNIVDYIKGE